MYSSCSHAEEQSQLYYLREQTLRVPEIALEKKRRFGRINLEHSLSTNANEIKERNKSAAAPSFSQLHPIQEQITLTSYKLIKMQTSKTWPCKEPKD